MVGPSRLQYPQATDAPGSNTVDKSDAMYSNSSMDPTFLNFSQMWPVTQAWSNVPLANYHHDLPFQQDYSNNDSFIQNQQTEPPDYDGNDDFYDNEMSKSNDAANLFTEHKGNSASLAAQNKAVTPIKPLVDQAKGSATDTKKSAAELRAFLLAKKRPGSATPSIPRAYNKDDNGAKVMSSTRQEKTVEKSSKSDETNAGSVGPVTSQSTDKSIQNPSNAQSLPARNADIEGLIDEYRAPEVTKEPRVLDLSTSASETISNGKTNRAASPTTPKSITTINPVKFLAKHAASPESPESGEIHSDQEPAIRPVKPDRAKNAAETVNNQPPKSAKKKITVDDVDQRQPPKTPQIRLDASKQAALQAKPIQDSLAQATDRRRSVQSNMEPRNVPLAQRITRSRQQEIQSPSLGDTRGGNVHRQESNDKVDKRDHEHPAKTSTSVMQQRPRLPWRSMTNERPDLYKQERKQNEELAALYKRQLAEQHTASPQHNDGKRPLIEPTILHNESVSNGAPADDASAEPVETQKANDVTLSEAPSTQGAPNSLSLHQHEQIQRLGIDLSPQGLSDLHDFLEYHRFYVEEYREGFFARQKRMRALEAERFALERESLRQFDHFSSMRAQSLTAREYTEPPTPVSVARHASIETPSVKPMPPPLTLPKRNSNGGVVAISGKEVPDSAVSSTNSAARTNGESTPRDAPQSDGVNVKRRRPSDEMDLDSSRKVARVDTDLRSNGKGQDISPMTQITHDRRFSSDYRPASHDFRGRSRSPTTRRRSFSPRGRASESGHPITREYDYWAGRGYDDRRPSADGLRRDSASTVCRNCDRIGHFTTNCPEERGDSHNRYTPSQPFRPFNSEEGHSRREPGVSLRNQPSYSNRGYRGGYRGGRASFPNNKPRFGFSSYTVGPATANGKTSESLNLNARGQSRSASSGLDRP
ncbi:MAG: hypothetical protein L6R40_005165 [Gallowayella cf. fulva]|nr:MAG: hypothetical protein L6R40_005165 [Xanthomendoza cf. fulva]